MNRLLCFFTGGHRYSIIKLRCRIVGDEVIYTNLCEKCGKTYETRLLIDSVFPHWMVEEKKETFEYCENEVLAMEELYDFLKDDSVKITEETEGE